MKTHTAYRVIALGALLAGFLVGRFGATPIELPPPEPFDITADVHVFRKPDGAEVGIYRPCAAKIDGEFRHIRQGSAPLTHAATLRFDHDRIQLYCEFVPASP